MAGIGMSALVVAIDNRADKEGDKETGAVEDLMREHGVLRRVLFIYTETSLRLRHNPSSVLIGALNKAARLFQVFGEEYHEKGLEETYIFPAIRKGNNGAARYSDILTAQHTRGREITACILDITRGTKLKTGNAAALASALESFVRMYRPHASREDTIVFPAWKNRLSNKQLDEMNDRFEEIEHRMFGENGFEEAVRQVADIEKQLGLFDLSQFTAPHPGSLE